MKGTYAVRFYQGKWTTPLEGWGPFCVFKTYKDAYKSGFGGEIWRCLYETTTLRHVWTSTSMRVGLKELTRGKALAAKVMLIEEVF